MYPYVVGPYFYGTKQAAKVGTISEPVTLYVSKTSSISKINARSADFSIFPNPGNDLIAIQCSNLNTENLDITLYNGVGQVMDRTHILPGSTIAYFDTRRLYPGSYVVKISGPNVLVAKTVVIDK